MSRRPRRPSANPPGGDQAGAWATAEPTGNVNGAPGGNVDGSRGIAAMAACLTGQAPQRPPTAAESKARAMLSSIDWLRSSGDPGHREVADALERGLLHLEDINALLGLKRRRGGARDTPHERARRSTVKRELVSLSECIGGGVEGASKVIAEWIAVGHERTLFLRSLGEVPRSSDGIARVIRTAEKG